MFKTVLRELKDHSSFTIFGAFTGIVVMLIAMALPRKLAYGAFYTLHPLHVALSAIVTSSMYERYRREGQTFKSGLWSMLLIGYVGSIAVATVSDSLIPYLGETVLGMPNRELHLGFLEEWPIVNGMAVLGIALAYWRPMTKTPHSLHVLVSTWASLFHVIMAMDGRPPLWMYPVILVLLFVAVWVPCCFSDIVFPLLFVKGDAALGSCGCGEAVCHGAKEIPKG
jgi:uncharacterized membrane protein